MPAAATRLAVLLFAAAVLGLPQSAQAAGKKSVGVRLNCDAYSKFEQRCHCGGTGSYFLNYGRKYCDRSLAETGWSAAGATWRDRTLLCLQRALADALPRKPAQHCDCETLKSFAFQSHVRCYTELPTSICLLPLSDWLIAYRIIDANDLLSEDGTRQIWAVTQTCLGQ